MKKKRRWLILVLTAVLICSVSLPLHATSIQDAKDDLEDMQSDLSQAQKVLKELEALKGNTEEYVAELDSKLAEFNKNLEDMNVRLSELETLLEETSSELEAAKEKEAVQYENMKKRIKYMYESGQTSYLQLFFESRSFSELLSKAEYISKVSEYDRNMLIAYQETKDYIAEAEAKLQASYEEESEIKAQIEQEQANIETLKAEKEQEVANYEEKIGDAQMELSEYEQAIEEQEALIAKKEKEEEERLRKEEEERKRKEEEERRRAEENSSSEDTETSDTSDTTDSGSSSGEYSGGKLGWPVPGYSINSEYGMRLHPIYGVMKLHNGCDIAAPTGTPIVAAESGTVLIAGYNSVNGNYVTISHGSGITTVYLHCSKLLVTEGQKVTKGQQIALVGMTGTATGAHLHFCVRVNGEYVNPRNYL
jgi:murein DD-endopeptidase MepM/ murein hydrolase activator NlpD